jgi:hypothetical protein
MVLGNAPSGTKIISWAVPNLSTTQVITSVTTRYYSKDGGNALKVIPILLTIVRLLILATQMSGPPH